MPLDKISNSTTTQTTMKKEEAGDNNKNIDWASMMFNSNNKQEEEDEDRNEILDAVWNVTSQMSRDVFTFLRKTAATALTSSLDPQEREELLQRMSSSTTTTTGGGGIQSNKSLLVDADADNDYEQAMLQTNSVQENIAAANVKAARQRGDPGQWEREKQAIYQQAEKAAQERVETELKIQKQRLEQEKQQFIQTISKQQQQQQQQDKASTTTTGKDKELEGKLEAMEKALNYKDQQAKKDYLEIVRLVQELNDAKMALQKEPDAAKEWRDDLSEEEKATLLKLKEAKPLNNNIAAAQTASNNVHPVLGPVVEDLGYKRIHLVSAKTLGNIPVYQKQRIYRQERVKAMSADKWKSMSLGFPGVICLHEDKTGALAIVDGQHRVGMMSLLQEKQQQWIQENNDKSDDNDEEVLVDFERVLVEVYPSDRLVSDIDDDKHAEELFLEINKAEPVKLVDMPGVAKAKDRKIITDAVESLYEMYTPMFSPSQRCRTPNVNVDNLRDNLFGADVIRKHNLTTSKKLVDWVLKQNQILANKYENDREQQAKISAPAWKKASQNKFYLGLESNWLYS